MTSRSASVGDGAAVGVEAEAVERLVRELLSGYERLLVLAVARREAIRSADLARLSACVRDENEVVQRLADLEKDRLRLIGPIATRLGSPDGDRTKLTWVAERMGGDTWERVRVAAQRLRETAGRLRAENEVGRSAASSLSRHMSGLVRSLRASLSHSRTYGSGGAVESGARVVSSLDLKS